MALRGVPEHPKFAALKAKLSLSKFEGMGLLETLWHFTGRYAPRGDIGRYSNSEIEAWLEWKGAPDAAVDALTSCGWIDTHKKYRLVIHDWHEHADNTTKKQVSRRAKTQLDKGLAVDWVFVGLEGVSPTRPDTVRTVSAANGNVSRPPAPAPAPAPAPEPNTPSTSSRGKRAAEKTGGQTPEGEEVANQASTTQEPIPKASEASQVAETRTSESQSHQTAIPDRLQASKRASGGSKKVVPVDPRFGPFRDHLKRYYGAVNKQTAAETPWGPVEDRALSSALIAEPGLTIEQLGGRLAHLVTAVKICSANPRMRRGQPRGNVGPRDPLASVIGRLPSYTDGPVDAFGERL